LQTKQTNFESLNLTEVHSIHDDASKQRWCSVTSLQIIAVVCQKCDYHHSIRSSGGSSSSSSSSKDRGKIVVV